MKLLQLYNKKADHKSNTLVMTFAGNESLQIIMRNEDILCGDVVDVYNSMRKREAIHC